MYTLKEGRINKLQKLFIIRTLLMKFNDLIAKRLLLVPKNLDQLALFLRRKIRTRSLNLAHVVMFFRISSKRVLTVLAPAASANSSFPLPGRHQSIHPSLRISPSVSLQLQIYSYSWISRWTASWTN